jgi:hypothetical protein
MKRLMLLIAVLAIAAFPAFAQFDNYHYKQNMNCSDCHSMHASAHNNLTDGSAIEVSNNPGGTTNLTINPFYPNQPADGRQYLLKAADVCEVCHDGKTWAPDVYGDNSNAYIRSAGGVRPHGNTVGGGHQIGSTVRPPGYDGATVNNYYGAGSELECYSCHSPHGGDAFRNLLGTGAKRIIAPDGNSRNPALATIVPSVTKSGTFSTTTDVTINATTRTWGTDLPAYYGRDKVAYSRSATPIQFMNTGIGASNRYDNFCGICHGKFHGGEATDTASVGDGTHFIKHPTGIEIVGDAGHGATPDAVFKANQAATVKVYQAGATVNPATDSVGCVSCHKAHGNNNPFALIYPDRTGGTVPSEEGGGTYRDLCKSCHPMGG